MLLLWSQIRLSLNLAYNLLAPSPYGSVWCNILLCRKTSFVSFELANRLLHCIFIAVKVRVTLLISLMLLFCRAGSKNFLRSLYGAHMSATGLYYAFLLSLSPVFRKWRIEHTTFNIIKFRQQREILMSCPYYFLLHWNRLPWSCFQLQFFLSIDEK